MTVYVRKSLAAYEVSNILPLDSVNCIITQKGTQKSEFLLFQPKVLAFYNSVSKAPLSIPTD